MIQIAGVKITTAQFFAIGSALVTLVIAVASQYLDPKEVATIGGAVGTFWGTLATVFTGQGSQVAAVAAAIEQPDVKAAIVPAVTGLKGVSYLQTNADADETMKGLAANNNTPALRKILPATG